MALAGSDKALSALIQSKIDEKLSAATGQSVAKSAYLQAYCDAISEAIIQHLLSKGECQSGIPVNTSGGGGSTTAPGKLI